MRRRLLIRLALSLAILAVIGGTLFMLWQPNRIILHNGSEKEVRDVELVLRRISSAGGAEVKRRTVERLMPGDSLTLRHRLSDSSVELSFTLGDRRFTHVVPYIDLWTGEAWNLASQRSGRLLQGYTGLSDHAPLISTSQKIE